MSEFLQHLGFAQIITVERLVSLARASLVLALGLLIARFIGSAAARFASTRLSPQGAMLLRRVVFLALASLVLATTLHQLGFQLGVLLGAAGVLTVAIGFASQTSASNLISGLFLIAERPFVVGDLIRLDGTTGHVLSIDLLSIKIRTHDNLFVRIPNEQIIKSVVTNLTRFPIRRIDMQLGVAYKEDLAKVREIIFEVADRLPECLTEPEPLFIFTGFGDSALQFQFSVWAKRENFLHVRNSIQLDIKAAFDQAGVEIPFPHRTIYAGSATEPIPVRVLEATTAG